MPRRKRVHPDALLLNYRQGRWYNEGPGEMDMNIKFEWTHSDRWGFAVWSYSLKGVDIGSVLDWGDGKFRPVFHGEPEGLEPPICNTLDEAKAWVEEQARAWLVEVSREQRLLTLANAFSEAYAKAMADQDNTHAWLKVHEAWCAYDDAEKEVMD